MMEKSPNAIFGRMKNGGCKWEGTKVNKTAGTEWMSVKRDGKNKMGKGYMQKDISKRSKILSGYTVNKIFKLLTSGFQSQCWPERVQQPHTTTNSFCCTSVTCCACQLKLVCLKWKLFKKSENLILTLHLYVFYILKTFMLIHSSSKLYM